MRELLRKLQLLLFWTETDAASPPSGPVLVTWENASGTAKVRVAKWYLDRHIGDEAIGPGWVDWWSASALDMTRRSWWKRLPL